MRSFQGDSFAIRHTIDLALEVIVGDLFNGCNLGEQRPRLMNRANARPGRLSAEQTPLASCWRAPCPSPAVAASL